MPTRVLMLITDLKTGGVPLHVYRLATSLDPHEFDLQVACLSPPGEVAAMLNDAGIETFACGARTPWDARALWRLARVIRGQRPDLVHAFLFHANTAACLIGPLVGVAPGRIITEIQTVEIDRPWHLAVGGLSSRLCRYVVGNSPAVVDHLQRAGHVPAARLKLIVGGVDPDRFADAIPVDRGSLDVPDDAFLLLWVGRLDPVKGLDELIDAVALLNDSRIRLVLAGEGPYESTTRRRVADAGLTDRARFLGRRGDVPNLLASADMFVFPSRTEGLPNALLEAMAAERPIVTTDVAGCRDLIADGQTGLLVPPRQPAQLADAIRRLIDDADLAARLGRAAKLHVTDRYSFAATVAKYAMLYRQTVDG